MSGLFSTPWARCRTWVLLIIIWLYIESTLDSFRVLYSSTIRKNSFRKKIHPFSRKATLAIGTCKVSVLASTVIKVYCHMRDTGWGRALFYRLNKKCRENLRNLDDIEHRNSSRIMPCLSSSSLLIEVQENFRRGGIPLFGANAKEMSQRIICRWVSSLCHFHPLKVRRMWRSQELGIITWTSQRLSSP